MSLSQKMYNLLTLCVIIASPVESKPVEKMLSKVLPILCLVAACLTQGTKKAVVDNFMVKNEFGPPTPLAELLPEGSCRTAAGVVGKCVPFYLCDNTTNTLNTDGHHLIDPRSDSGTPCPGNISTCCLEGDVRSPNDPITPRPSPSMSSCRTAAGVVGKCVPFYLCDNTTNTLNTDGHHLIDPRSDSGTPCPGNISTCCLEGDVRSPNDPITPRPSPSMSSCRTAAGVVGKCVPFYLCDNTTNTLNTDGHHLIDPRSDSGTPCPGNISTCCLEGDVRSPNDPITPRPSPSMSSCRTAAGVVGKCVPFYLCDNTTNTLNTDGHHLIDPRSDSGTPCPGNISTCCLEGDVRSPNDPITPRPSPSMSSCETTEGVAGKCVAYYQCDNTTNTLNKDGHYHINIRADIGRPCPEVLDTCCSEGDVRPPNDPITPRPEPVREGCGWHNPKGVSILTTGEEDGETKFAEFPWMCAIRSAQLLNGNEPDSKYVGGGSLIHPSVVLTAAHNVASTEWSLQVRAGDWDTQTIKEPYPYQERDVARFEKHKDFNNGNLFYDISLLFLSKPMDLAPNVQLACLPPPSVKPAAGTRCFATGWGKDRFGKDGHFKVILKKIELPVVGFNSCQEQLRKTRLGPFFELHSSFMCAGGEKDRDACKGDGGSPLVCPIEDETGRFAQTGIVAWGIGCGGDGTPGVYVDVANLRDWIDDKMKGYDTTVYSY